MIKAKDLTLGISALTIAIGSALGSLKANQDLYIRLDTSPNLCRDITNVCNRNPTGIVCRVHIPTLGTKDAYLQDCQTFAYGNSTYPVLAELIEE